MSQMKEWLTVIEAAFVVGRDQRQIYRWLKVGKLSKYTDPRGRNLINSAELVRVESTIKRGRPEGTASRNGENK